MLEQLPPRSASATAPSVTQPTQPSSSAPYGWQRDTGLSLELGGGTSSTLATVVAPAASGKWLIAGTQFSTSGPSVATVWTSSNAMSWTKAALPTPTGAGGRGRRSH